MQDLKREDGSSMKDGINNNTYELLFKSHEDNDEGIIKHYKEFDCFFTIDSFTKIQEKKIFTKLLNKSFKERAFDTSKIKYNEEKGLYEYKDKDLVIDFNMLSNSITDEDLIKELTSDKRYGKCHEMAMNLAPAIDGSKIVTGYIMLGNQKFLHSIIELEKDGEKLIIDWTRNLMITKEQYIKLTKFVELSSFEGEKVLDDLKIGLKKLPIGITQYLLFRNELIKDMKKNPQIFNENNEDIRLR